MGLEGPCPTKLDYACSRQLEPEGQDPITMMGVKRFFRGQGPYTAHLRIVQGLL